MVDSIFMIPLLKEKSISTPCRRHRLLIDYRVGFSSDPVKGNSLGVRVRMTRSCRELYGLLADNRLSMLIMETKAFEVVENDVRTHSRSITSLIMFIVVVEEALKVRQLINHLNMSFTLMTVKFVD